MGLNNAGLDALLNDGNEAVFWAGIGDGVTAGDQTSSARIQLTLGAPSAGVITTTNVPLSFTGTPLDGATHVLLFSASTSGTFYGFKALTGDQAFNAAGEYDVTALTMTGTSPT